MSPWSPRIVVLRAESFNQWNNGRMAGGDRSRRKRQNLLGSHQKCWVWGRHVVRELLRRGRWMPLGLWISDAVDPDEAEEVCRAASRRDIPVERKSHDDLTLRCRSAAHQGLLARMPPFPYWTLPELFQGAAEPPLLLVLDRLQDPHNLGAMIRSAEVFGVDGILIGTRSQCGVTASVVRSSAGAINHVRIAQVDDLAEALRELSRRGVRVVSSSGDAEVKVSSVELSQPAAFVVGNEGMGIDPELLAVSDDVVRIPQFGRVASLNAAVAAGILLYEARRQRTIDFRSPCPSH